MEKNITKETLETKLEDLQVSFNNTQAKIAEIEAHEKKLARTKQELNVELFRFQGEHRLLKDLLETFEEKKEEVIPEKAPEGEGQQKL